MTRAAAKPPIAIPVAVFDAVVEIYCAPLRAAIGTRRWWKRQLKARGIAVAPRKARAK